MKSTRIIPFLVCGMLVLGIGVLVWRNHSLSDHGINAGQSSPVISPVPGSKPGVEHLEKRARHQASTPAPELEVSSTSSSSPAWQAALLAALGAPDNVNLLKWLEEGRESLSGTEHKAMLLELARILAATNPGRAMALLSELDSPGDRQSLTALMTRTLFESNAAAAIDWVGALADSKLAQLAHETLARDWAATDRDAVIVWIAKLENGELQTSAAEGLIWSWAQSDVREAVAWAGQLPDSALRDAVFLKTAKILAIEDPQAAASWSAKFPEGPGRESAVGYAVHQWTATDATAAGTWALGLEDSSLQRIALGAVASAWANQEPARAAQWTLQLPPAARAGALPVVTSKWAMQDAAAARSWVNSLPDPVERQQLVNQLGEIPEFRR